VTGDGPRTGTARGLLDLRNNAHMVGSPSNSDAAFIVVSDGDAYALHLRCCDVHLKFDADDQPMNEAIARHLSRVHGYIGAIDNDITLEALRRRLPTDLLA
jgi:hypothetical protein